MCGIWISNLSNSQIDSDPGISLEANSIMPSPIVARGLSETPPGGIYFSLKYCRANLLRRRDVGVTRSFYAVVRKVSRLA